MSARLSCTLALPPRFRAGDMLAFHRRDAQEIAERVTEQAIHKGIVWRGKPACLAIRFEAHRAEAELAIDGSISARSQQAFENMVRRMLGLNQDIERFEQRYRRHPQLGPLIQRQAGLRVPVSPTPFEALTWAIAAQQISVKAAIALRRNLIRAAGVRHSDGLWCYPEARQLANLTTKDLRNAGFSAAKTRTLLALSAEVANDTLPLDAWLDALPMAEIEARLLAVRGIGPWTVNYTLLRGFGWLDGSLHGDAAVRRGMQVLLKTQDKISEQHAKAWLAEFSPWRALVAAHLWTMLTTGAY